MSWSSVILPTQYPGWNPRVLINDLKPLGQPFDFPFPDNYLPSQYINALSILSNSLIDLPSTSTIFLGLGVSPAFLAALAATTTFIMYTATLKRSGNSASTSPDYGVLSISVNSPRFGYSIGTRFKHQAYISLDITLLGFIGGLTSLSWLPLTSLIPKVEYRVNCKFKRFYVRNGTLLNVTTSSTDPKKVTLKLFESTSSPDFSSAPVGSIKVFKSNGTSASFNLSSVDSGWGVNAEATDENASLPSAGDFYEVSTPWVIEDPQLMFEYELGSGYGGYKTKYQRMTTVQNVIGMWMPPSGDSTEYTPYVNADFQDYMATKVGDGVTIAGTGVDGFSAFNALNSIPSTIRIIINENPEDILPGDSTTKHNYMAGNLVGEYVEAGGNYYEIVEHPMYNTIGVKNQAVTSGNLFSQTASAQQIKVHQQNFWKISEIYYENQSLWQGEVINSSGTKITWKAAEDVPHKTTLSATEIEVSGYSSLAERIRSPISIRGSSSANVFKKYGGWLVISKGEYYKVKSFSFANSDDEGFLNITCEIDGDIGTAVKTGDTISVAFDTPYETASGVSKAANFNLGIEAKPALYENNTWKLFMNGFYDAGYYKTTTPMDTSNMFSVVDFSFGVDDAAQGRGVPAIMVQTKKRLIAVSFIEQGPEQRQCFFYMDPTLDTLAFRSSWQRSLDRIEQQLVAFGESTKITGGGDVPESTKYLVSEMTFDIPSSSSNTADIYWMYLPGNTVDEPSAYFSALISGLGGVKTGLTKKYNLVVDSTAVSPVALPFEYYSPIGQGTSSGQVVAMVYSKYRSDTIWSAGLEKMVSSDKLKALLSGSEVSATSAVLAPSSIQIVKSSNMLKATNIFDAHATGASSMFLIYGKDSPVFYPVGDASADSGENASKPCVFMIWSQNSGKKWSSPKFMLSSAPTTDTQDIVQELNTPMMLMHDFRQAGSLLEMNSNIVWIFGYGYTREGSTDTDGDLDHLFLGVYQFNLGTLSKDKTYPLKAKKTSGFDLEDNEVFAYHRPPYANNMSDFGATLVGDTQTQQEGAHSEHFIKIAGGKKSGAIIQDLTFFEDVIGVTMLPSGTIKLLIRDEEADGIVQLVSESGGQKWSISTNNNERLVVARGGRAPHLHGDYLFYFDGDSLKCKRTNIEIAGKYSSQQELLDAYPSSLVATGIPSQRIASAEEQSGVISAYMVTLDGYLTARTSMNGGTSWTGKANW